MQDTYIYPAIFEKSTQGKYGISFPDLPGCISIGDDLQHAHTMAKEALGLHLWEWNEMAMIYLLLLILISST